MDPTTPTAAPSRLEGRLALGAFVLCLLFNLWGVHVGWESKNLPGGEFRQAQTALSAYWIKAENNFSLAYPTPVIGKPWSIPLEFPLYQWTVVVVSKVTNWSLTKAGRAVSIACFYLCLPAVFLLLKRWAVAPGHRWLVLAVVVTCPFYIFYARAFLIETMALMFSLWFWVGFERAVAERNKAWLVLAVVAGTGAGLVKVTTFMLYLLPAGWWALSRLWAARKGDWKSEFAWMAAAAALPFAVTLWWTNFATATRTLNPLAGFLLSKNLTDFTFGTSATRWSLDLWLQKFLIVKDDLSWTPVILLCAVIPEFTGLAGKSRRREMALCGLWFLSVLLIFPILFAYHQYYYAANALLLLIAMGLALVSLAEARLTRGIAILATGVVLGGQAWRYLDHYHPTQSAISQGGDGLSRSLRTLTNPDDVIVILGQDWNSMLPYYAQRRAVMIREDIARTPAKVEEAMTALAGEKIGAVIIVGEAPGQKWVIDLAAARGIGRVPLYHWRDARILVPEARRNELLHGLLENDFDEVALAPEVVLPREKLANKWFEMAAIHRWQRKPFHAMEPAPVRFFATFGPNLDEAGGQTRYGAHPVSRLVFALPAGPHRLRSSLQMPLDAYKLDLQESEATDGVEITLFALGPGEQRRVLATRHFDPRHNRDDRGNMRPLAFDFTLPAAGEVELFFGPGPSGKDTRDWIEVGPLKIE